jgi:hypothetical protein
VFLTSFYMTRDAAQWYALLEKNQGTPTWAEFEKLINQRFGPPIHGNALGELIQLRREMTVVDYQTRFLVLVNRCTGLAEPLQINIFTTGLRDPLKTNVELQQPATLEDAMALARAYENWLAMPNDAAGHSGSRQTFSRTKPLALPAPPPVVGARPPAPQQPLLSPASSVSRRPRWRPSACAASATIAPRSSPKNILKYAQ